MEYVIIPDIHLKHEKANRILERHANQGYTFVFLGDYFDNFGDDSYMNGRTATWLTGVINRDDVVCLLGNHDLGYIFAGPPKFRECPGYTPEKHRWIRSNLDSSVIKKIRLAFIANGWFLSHAGINSYYVRNQTLEGLMEVVDECYLAIRKAQRHEMLNFGWRMNEYHMVGGILWQDWEWEFSPLKGINQIVGHTTHKKPVFREPMGSRNLCLDDHLNSYAIIREDGGLELYNVSDGKRRT